MPGRSSRRDPTSFYHACSDRVFRSLARTARLAARRDWSKLVGRAETIDQAIEHTHAAEPDTASFALSLVGCWSNGRGVLDAWTPGTSGQLSDALLLESLGQAIAAPGLPFQVPSASRKALSADCALAGLPSDVGLALSLAKRAREILWALPGLCWHRSEQAWRRT